jgi:hypothetical protein
LFNSDGDIDAFLNIANEAIYDVDPVTRVATVTVLGLVQECDFERIAEFAMLSLGSQGHLASICQLSMHHLFPKIPGPYIEKVKKTQLTTGEKHEHRKQMPRDEQRSSPTYGGGSLVESRLVAESA